MLQLGRRKVCRLTSSYVCASCLATSHPSPIPSRRPAVAGYRGRPFSTTIACRGTTVTESTDAAADAVAAEVRSPPPQEKKKKKKAASKETGKETGKGSSNADSSTRKSPRKGAPDTDLQRKLNILEGALSALKKVLVTKGVDVSQIPIPELDTSSPATTSPARKNAKPKANKTKDNKSKSAAAPVEDGRSKAGKGTKAKATSSKSKSKAQDTQRKSARARRGSKRKQEVSGQVADQPADQSAESKPANLGVPFTAIAKSLSETGSKSSKSPNPPTDGPERVHANDLSLCPISTPLQHVPSLSYGLRRVLFNPGVYQLQDPRSRVYNFDPYLSEIMPVDEFDFNALKEYVTSSKDNTLISIAKEHQKKYTGSTSSMTSMLAHFHYLLSNWRYINASMLSRGFVADSMQFTRIMRAPAAIFLHWKDGTYAIDADKEFDTANILSMLGKSMEKLLTLSKQEYERYRHGNSDQITEEERNAEEAFHYTGFQDFMMRSQLDAHDPRVPGSGMFDLKTRAVVSIRMDAQGYEKGRDYEIRKRHGQWESFEREYFDMIRSAFLKYSLQVRMGRMDGIFVAYHNTQRIFGFQYIPLTEMDLTLHGTDNTRLGDQEFKLSLKLLNELLNRATQKWPEQSLRVHFETRTSTKGAPFMYFFAKPTNADEIAAVQNAGKASVEAFEKEILGITKRAKEDDIQDSAEADDTQEEQVREATSPAAQEIDSYAAWQEVRQMVEEAVGDDELGVGPVREAIGDALEQSGILRARSLAESREYVNALLGALTGRTPSAQGDMATINPDDDVAIDNNEIENQPTERAQEELGQSSSPVTSHPGSTLGQEIETEESPRSVYPEQEDSTSTGNEHNVHVDSDRPHPGQLTENENVIQPRDPQITSTEGMETEPSNIVHENVDGTATTGSCSSISEDIETELEEDDNDEQTSETDFEDGVEVEKSGEDVGSMSLEPLKSLIMRMAQRIGERPTSDIDISNPQDDASKLKEFERILKRLISHSRTEPPMVASGENTQEADSASASTPLDGTPADDIESDQLFNNPAPAKETSQPLSAEQTEEPEEPELLGLTLTIKNKLNGAYVDKPNVIEKNDDWTVEYEVQEIKASRAQLIYAQIKERRRKVLNDNGDKEAQWHKMFEGNLATFSAKGRQYRAQETQKAEGQPFYVASTEEPLQWEDVFPVQPKNSPVSDEGQNHQDKEDETAK